MSDPAFVEVFQTDLRMEVTRQFPFLHADGYRWAMPKFSDNGAVILELSQIKNLDIPLMFSISAVRPPAFMTPVAKEHSVVIMDLSTKADAWEKQLLWLDPVFANITSIEPLIPVITSVSLAPTKLRWNLYCPLVVVSNCGACEVRVRQSNLRYFDHVLVNVSDIWLKDYTSRHPVPSGFGHIKEFTDYFANVVITTACWTDRVEEMNKWSLSCATRAGQLVQFSICGDIGSVESVTETKLRSIHFLKYYSADGMIPEDLLIVGTCDGICKVFRRQADVTLVEAATLWGVKDKMAIHCMEFYFDKERDEILAATAKGSHFMAFILRTNGELIAKVTHFVGSILVSGIQHFQNYQFIATTINAHTTLLTLSYDSNKLYVDSTYLSNTLDNKSYQVLGMAATKNKAGWLFLQFPIQLYEHSFRSPTMLTICSLNIQNTLQIIEENSDKKMFELLDCAEILRSTYLKYGLPDIEPSIDLHLQCDRFDEHLVRKLKIFAVELSARLSYLKKKMRSEDILETQSQINSIRKVIEVYCAYKRLTHLTTLSSWTSGQQMSGVYYRKKILSFNSDESVTFIREVWSSYVASVSDLLARTEALTEIECEKCVFCDDFVNSDTGTCQKNHKVTRCCITFLQIPLFGALACDTCQYAAIDDDFLLKQVLCPGESVCCPLCDGPLTSAKSLLYLR